MSDLDLKDYLFRVYTKFRAVDLTSHSELKSKVEIIEKCNLTKLVRLLVLGSIDSNNHNPTLIQDEFLSLLYDLDGKSSALALSLLDKRILYQVDLGYLLTNSSNNSDTKYKVSLSTFILILLFYSSVDYRNIGYNMKIAIDRFVSYAKNSYLVGRFPEINQDLGLLKELLNEDVIDEVKPSRFRDVIQKIGNQIQEYVKTLRDRDNVNGFIAFWKGLVDGLDKTVSLSDLMDAMFDLFKAGYYPASISSVFPDTVLATIPNKGVSGQLDYLLLLDQDKCPKTLENAGAENNIVRVVFMGSYADKSLLFENESRWRLIEERLPGVWKLFRIIYKRLQNGEYNTSNYKFSNYQFFIKDDDEKINKAAKVRWLNLFSSFILGHVINLIATGSEKQVYKVAAPVINNRDTGSYLVPADFYGLQKPVIYYEVNDNIIEPKYYEGHRWYQYQGDSVYTPTSSSVSDIASYNASYAIVINDEKFTDVNIKSYGGNINDWNEVVEAEVESRGSAASDAGKIPDTLHFKLYSDDGEVVDIKLKASSDKEGENIEPNQVNLESLGSNYEI
jgi:hypothetical protein